MKRYLVGKRISLHGLSPREIAEDAPYFGWLDDLQYDQFTERSRLPNSPERMAAYYQKANQPNGSLVFLGIYDNETGRHIGNISFKEINWSCRRGWLGYLIGDPEFRGKGIATDAILMFMLYGFNKLNFNRIFTTVSEPNLASRKLAEKTGLKEEGRMRGHIITGGRMIDVFMYGVLRDDWLKSHGERARDLFEEAPF